MVYFARRWFACSATLAALLLCCAAGAQDAAPSIDAKQYEKAVNKALEFLSKAQAEDGSFSAQASPAVTALVITGVLRNGRPASDPVVSKGLKYLEGFVQEDGGIYNAKGNHKNYETCLAMLAFAEANKDKRYDKLLAGADKFVKGMQWDGSEGHEPSSVSYGGAGYGGKTKDRPDLSNTNFLIEALKASGNAADSEAMKKALVFVSRCQNLESAHNTTPLSAKVNDGGFYYTPFGGGQSQAGNTDNGGLRSYGSMTYAGLKSMIFAGVGPDDPRVKAAFGWIQKNYDLKSNPGMGTSGLFYYYQTFAKALNALGVEEITDATGKKHAWRAELLAELVSRQDANGSWINPDKRWMEGDPNLSTGYALLTLSYIQAKSPAAVKSPAPATTK